MCSMSSKVFPLRASEAERQRWQQCADLRGLSFNAWARQMLNEAAALDEAVRETEERL